MTDYEQIYCEVCGDTKEHLIRLEYKCPVCVVCAKELALALLEMIDDD